MRKWSITFVTYLLETVADDILYLVAFTLLSCVYACSLWSLNLTFLMLEVLGGVYVVYKSTIMVTAVLKVLIILPIDQQTVFMTVLILHKKIRTDNWFYLWHLYCMVEEVAIGMSVWGFLLPSLSSCAVFSVVIALESVIDDDSSQTCLINLH